MKINNRRIGHHYPPYIVAEMSGNHNRSIANAFRIIEQARMIGADAVKLQCYLPETICAPYTLTEGPWKGRELRDLYKEAHTPREWFSDLFEVANSYSITIFSSVFDREGVDFLEKLDCPAYKISSFDIVDLQLIRYVADTGKPIILSTGMASDQEIMDADDAIPPQHPHMFLHCVSGYPTPIKEARLGRMRTINRMVQLPVDCGISDHSLGSTIAIAAIALGAPLIEKHLTLDRAAGGPDAEFSMEPQEFAQMVQSVQDLYHALYADCESKSERTSVLLRKSLFSARNLSAGEPLTETSVVALRPNIGIPVGLLDEVLGKHLRRSLERGSPIALSDLE